MEAIATGRFSHRLGIDPDRDDEFGRLARSYRTMADQLAELERIRAEFVSVASHELKTPINVIIGYLQLLEEQLYGPMSPKQLEIVRVLESQAGSLARLVQHLMDVSRFRAGGARLEPRPLELRPLLAELQTAFGVLALQRNVSFDVHADANLPETVIWDADRINEVLGNLLSNAFKFTPAGGRVVLAARAAGEHVTIEVRDTGAGIAPAQLRHIFDKFFQADNQAEADTKGSGLGLAIAKELVEAHGGRISVESTVGEGSSFAVALPTDVRAAVVRRTRPARQDGPSDSARPGFARSQLATPPTPPPVART
jgi:signal transduction histidine kinase